jgi:hypothetical protein
MMQSLSPAEVDSLIADKRIKYKHEFDPRVQPDDRPTSPFLPGRGLPAPQPTEPKPITPKPTTPPIVPGGKTRKDRIEEETNKQKNIAEDINPDAVSV